MKETRMPPAKSANLSANSGNSIYGVSVIVYSAICSDADQKKISKFRVTGLCVGNSPVIGEFPTQRGNNAENVSIWWRHHDSYIFLYSMKYEVHF